MQIFVTHCQARVLEKARQLDFGRENLTCYSTRSQ